MQESKELKKQLNGVFILLIIFLVLSLLRTIALLNSLRFPDIISFNMIIVPLLLSSLSFILYVVAAIGVKKRKVWGIYLTGLLGMLIVVESLYSIFFTLSSIVIQLISVVMGLVLFFSVISRRVREEVLKK